MIVLDTNVISELMRADPTRTVLEWLAAQSRAELFTTTVTQAEIYYGLALLPEGKRRSELQLAARAAFDEDFAGRILSFDSDAALAYFDISATGKLSGKAISQFDAEIADIVRSRGARLATRNVRDFVACGITLVNPWEFGAA